MTEAEEPTGQADESKRSPPTPESSESTSAPQSKKIPKKYIHNAQQFGRIFIIRPLDIVVIWLDGHDGLVTALATVAIAWLTWNLATYAGHQEKIIQGQLAEMHSQAQAFNATQRAFVTLKDVKLAAVPFGANNSSTTLYDWTTIIENSGDTPTRNLIVKIGLITKAGFVVSDLPGATSPIAMTPEGPSDPEHPYSPDKSESGYELNSFRIVLGPHGTAPIDGMALPILNVARSIPYGRFSQTYEYGILRYRDIFPGTPEHITKFCYKVVLAPNEHGVSVPTYRLCRHWNCADDECAQDREDYLAEYRDLLKGSKKPLPPELQQ
ncbi:MAG: hypothetical protein K8R18_11540 [Parvibaculum sp.]|uniref:hypothetical protein n=1 Tax=Parvibaculum sp. TaxID=2024848 RepID=UPI0025E1BA46|nr:hypothetical protein [Parvibaculum sp.]MCE9650243.1 hypothetical protein [Parvibaculum sp.]